MLKSTRFNRPKWHTKSNTVIHSKFERTAVPFINASHSYDIYIYFKSEAKVSELKRRRTRASATKLVELIPRCIYTTVGTAMTMPMMITTTTMCIHICERGKWKTAMMTMHPRRVAALLFFVSILEESNLSRIVVIVAARSHLSDNWPKSSADAYNMQWK